MYDIWFENLYIKKFFGVILITPINEVGHEKFMLFVLFTKNNLFDDIMFVLMNLD